MDAPLPSPLVPPEVNLDGLDFMPLRHLRVMQSTLFAKSTGDEFKAAFALWCASWTEKPAGSLPDDDDLLEYLSRSKAWRKVKARALHGWIRCSDGRLYHAVIAPLALDAWARRSEFREEQDNKESRQKRWRETVKRLCGLLRSAGVTPPRGASKAELVSLCVKHVDGFVDAEASTETSTETSTGTSTVDGAASTWASAVDVSPGRPVDAAETAKTVTVTVTGTVKREEKERERARAVFSATDTRARGGLEPQPRPEAPPDPDPDPDPEPDIPDLAGHTPTAAGLACRAMKRAGLQAVNPGDPRLLALLAQGATEAEFEGLAAEAAAKGKGVAWVLVALEGRRAEAAAIALAPPPAADPLAWAKSRSGVVNRGCNLGIGPWDELAAANGVGPSWADYRASVLAADQGERGEGGPQRGQVEPRRKQRHGAAA